MKKMVYEMFFSCDCGAKVMNLIVKNNNNCIFYAIMVCF